MVDNRYISPPKKGKYSGGLVGSPTPGEKYKKGTKFATGGSGARYSRRQLEAARQRDIKRAADEARRKADAERKASAEKLAREQAAANKLRQEMVAARRIQDKSLEAAKAVQLREQLTRVARARGKPFTKSEARSFLGGGAGVQALRSGAAAEMVYFKKTGVSLSQQRERLRQQAETMGGVSLSRIVAETLPSQRAGYVRVRFPNGKIEEVRSSGQVNFNKGYAGEKVIVRDGQVVQVGDDKVDKVKVGTVNVYSKKSLAEALKLKTKVISGAKREEFQKLSSRYISDVSGATKKLENSAARDEIGRLSELQRKRTLTTAERQEKKRLEKNVAANYRRVSEVIAKSIAISLIGAGIGSVELTRKLREDPAKTLRELPRATWEGLKSDFQRARSSTLGLVTIAAEYAVLGQALRGIGKAAKGSLRTLSKVNPKYVKLVNGKYVVRSTKLSVKKPYTSIKSFLTGKDKLSLRGQTVKTGASPLSAQTKFAGKQVTAVNAAANQLTSWIRRKAIIRKPIPGEANFPTKIKNALKKFDSGKRLTNKEFAETNLWLQKNVAPNITLLERSLYLDPTAGLRASRLGITKAPTATLKDILRGNFRLWQKAGKPQVLIFENSKVAKFPKALKNIEAKLKSGKKLTTAETNKLIRWQTQTGSGKFKPIGSTIYQGGKELEVTLAPGELIKRVNNVGFRYIDGKKVTFVTVEVFKPTKALSRQMQLANAGKLTKAQLTKLEQVLSKKLGRRIKVETPNLRKLPTNQARRISPNTPVLRIRANGILARSFRSIRPVTRKPAVRKVVKRKPVKRKSTVRKPSVRKPTKRKPTTRRPAIRKPTPKRPVRRTAARTMTSAARKKVIAIPVTPKGFKRRKLTKPTEAYYVIVRRRGKPVKLMAKPLTKNDARDYLAYSIDNGLERSAFLVPIGKTTLSVRPPKKMIGYYGRTARKLRPYKIRMGRKKELLNGFIEKKKYIGDTKREIKQLQSTRKPKKRVAKRKTSKKKK